MWLKQQIPNTITLCNLFCGCLALVNVFQGNLSAAAYLVALSLFFDFFDGFFARMLKVSSAIGKDLDSLADMVSFGVVPGTIMFQLINLSLVKSSLQDSQTATFHGLWSGHNDIHLYSYIAFIIIIFSCIRLARFNNDTRQTNSFIGLPTPANAIFISSLPLIFETTGTSLIFLLNPYILIILSIVLSLLLIAEIPLFALKFKSFAWLGNGVRYSFLLASVALLIALKYLAIPFILILYISLSIVNNIFLKKEV